jgi:hypothetical protein
MQKLPLSTNNRSNSVDNSEFVKWIKCFEHWSFSAQLFHACVAIRRSRSRVHRCPRASPVQQWLNNERAQRCACFTDGNDGGRNVSRRRHHRSVQRASSHWQSKRADRSSEDQARSCALRCPESLHWRRPIELGDPTLGPSSRRVGAHHVGTRSIRLEALCLAPIAFHVH